MRSIADPKSGGSGSGLSARAVVNNFTYASWRCVMSGYLASFLQRFLLSFGSNPILAAIIQDPFFRLGSYSHNIIRSFLLGCLRSALQ